MLLIVILAMALLIKVKFMKPSIWLNYGIFPFYSLLKIINMRWELLSKDLLQLTNYIKEESDSTEVLAAFETFCVARERAVIAEIRIRCGVTVHASSPQDLEESEDD
jgi:hypothetical protein